MIGIMAYRKVLLYLVGIPHISTNSSTLCPTMLGGGSHVQKPSRPNHPSRNPPGLGYHQAMLTLPPALTFRPKISPGPSHNIIIIPIK